MSRTYFAKKSEWFTTIVEGFMKGSVVAVPQVGGLHHRWFSYRSHSGRSCEFWRPSILGLPESQNYLGDTPKFPGRWEFSVEPIFMPDFDANGTLRLIVKKNYNRQIKSVNGGKSYTAANAGKRFPQEVYCSAARLYFIVY